MAATFTSPAGGATTDGVAWLRSCVRLKGYSPATSWGEECSAVAAAFLASPSSHRLVGYMASNGELCLHTGSGATAGSAPRQFVYWLKRVPGAPLTGGQPLSAALLFGTASTGGVASLTRLVEDVYLPGVKAASSEWPDSVRGELTGQVQVRGGRLAFSTLVR